MTKRKMVFILFKRRWSDDLVVRLCIVRILNCLFCYIASNGKQRELLLKVQSPCQGQTLLFNFFWQRRNMYSLINQSSNRTYIDSGFCSFYYSWFVWEIWNYSWLNGDTYVLFVSFLCYKLRIISLLFINVYLAFWVLLYCNLDSAGQLKPEVKTDSVEQID